MNRTSCAVFGVLSLWLITGAGCRRTEPGADRKGATAKHAEQDAAGDGAPHAEDRVTLSPEAVEGAGIETGVVAARGFDQELRVTAVVKPNDYRLAHVNPRIPGRAVEVRAVLGERVRAGQILATLDSLELGERKSSFLQARTNLDVARRNYQREERLVRQQISSQKEFLEARGEFERSEAAYQAAREALRLVGLADGEIEKITWGSVGRPMSRFPLMAPFAGTIVEQHITVGELIQPEENPYTIADLSTVWVLLDIYEKDLARVAPGDRVRVGVEAYPDQAFDGTVTYVSNLLDSATRTARARVEVANTDGRLKPGMFASAVLSGPVGDAPRTLTIPRDAVQRVRGDSVAFVEEAPGTFELRTLRLGKETGSDVQVLDGLAAGERVVTAGGFYLKSELLKEEMSGHDH